MNERQNTRYRRKWSSANVRDVWSGFAIHDNLFPRQTDYEQLVLLELTYLSPASPLG